MQNFSLYQEYLTLGQFLKEAALISTGGQAKLFLAEHEGGVFVNGELENRRGKKLVPGDQLEIPALDLAVSFVAASPEDVASREEEKLEEERVRALVKKMNAQNKPAKAEKSKKPSKPRSPFNKK
ncbi:S4 domain-containing protein YaaA [Lactococcus termiticola]|uniref:Uncharacterized protein n=1 Tax=Lactococcus termiticola TaxID=2169526 RepID=A0A2R5HEG3_9LACT|nr:S4 domain-containing protein YaaA [Lactococcus termiticola]GBG96463.1 hypothetical protein NtB2_00575 [Lactococcus termiticola]